jgi:hypothetical protein
MLAIGSGIGTEAPARGTSQDFALGIEGNMNVGSLSRGVRDESEVGFSSEVNMRNSRGMRGSLALFADLCAKLTADLIREICSPTRWFRISLQFYDFSKHTETPESMPDSGNSAGGISQRFGLVNIKTKK